MWLIALIDDPRVVERILRHLGAWHDPPAGLSPQGAARPDTYQLCDAAARILNYENVLAD
jgi:hypothetical protein